MLINSAHIIYDEETFQRVIFPFRGVPRANFNGKDLESLRVGGYPWRVYSEPVGYDQEAHNLDGVFVLSGALEITQGYIAKSQAEIDSTRDEAVASAIYTISAAAREYVELRANAALQYQIYEHMKLSTPDPRMVEVYDWGRSIYNEAEVRKAQFEAGLSDDVVALSDFSSFGDKPYTVYQLYTWGLINL